MIEFHLLYFIVMFIAFLTGLFREFILFNSIIFIHEIGHALAALYYKWRIDKIVIMPFGGITIFNEKLNRSIKEEFVILILGPIFQIIYYKIFSIFLNSYAFMNYHYSLLLFNLLPIYPLDGAKLLNLLFNKILPFKKSHLLILIVSFLVSILTILYIIVNKLGLLLFLVVFLLLFKLIEENNKHEIIFNKFLLERYLYSFNFKKHKIIKDDNLEKMFRGYEHIFLNGEKYVTERELLRKRFDKHRRL